MSNSIKDVALSEVDSTSKNLDSNPNGFALDLIGDVEVDVNVIAGTTTISLSDLFKLKKGSVLQLVESIDTEVIVEVNKKVVAKGALVAVDENFGVEITEVFSPAG